MRSGIWHALFSVVSYVLFNIPTSGLAQTPKKTVIAGSFSTPTDGTITLSVFKRNFFPQRGFLDARTDTVKISNNFFRFELPGVDSSVYITLIKRYDPRQKRGILWLDRYLLKAGSNIIMTIKPDTVLFEGIGADLFNVQYAAGGIAKAIAPPNNAKRDSLVKYQGEYAAYLASWNHRKSQYEKKRVIVESYKNRLDKQTISDLLTGYRSEHLDDYFGWSFTSFFQRYAKEKQDASLKFYGDSLFRIDPALDYSGRETSVKFYSRLIMTKLGADIKYKARDFEYGSPRILPLLLDTIKNTYTGLLRERLLMDFVIDMSTRSVPVPAFYEYLKKVEPLITAKSYKAILAEFLANQAGRPAYQFILPDQAGKLVNLADFKGKYIVADFWFKGCSFCMDLERQMRQVREQFKGNSKLVFLSINVDARKDAWMEGLKTGLYTDEQNINLSTYGLGTQHEAFKYYGYQGCPQLLIIDKDQNIFNARPLKPFSDKDRTSFVELLKSMISK
jgi:peroxiredoxin